MSTVQEIQTAIEGLPQDEFVRLLGWLREKDWQAWDAQLASDAVGGKLNFLAEEAVAEKTSGRLKEI